MNADIVEIPKDLYEELEEDLKKNNLLRKTDVLWNKFVYRLSINRGESAKWIMIYILI